MTDPLAQVSFYARSLDCVHCGLCLEACPTYRTLGLETDSPRGRIYLMRAYAEGTLEDPASIRPHLDRCLDCRACESVCPSGVRYGEILETVRSEMAKAQPSRSLAVKLRRLLLKHLLAHQGRLRWAFRLGWLGERLGLRWLASKLGILKRHQAALLPPIPSAAERRSLAGTYRPRGESRGTVYLFTGCVMEQMFGRINRATLDLLLANGFTVEVPKAQGCCGALHVHDGQADVAKQLATHNLDAFPGPHPIVLNSAGCGCAMKEYGHLLGNDAGREFSTRVIDVSQFLAKVGLQATPAVRRQKVAYDDPCHLCHGQGVRKEPRQLLAQVPGLQLVAHQDPEDCCGSAGIYNLLQPQLAGEIGKRKVEALMRSGAEVVATGNPGCMLQIRACLQLAGSGMEVVHPVELLLPESRGSSA